LKTNIATLRGHPYYAIQLLEVEAPRRLDLKKKVDVFQVKNLLGGKAEETKGRFLVLPVWKFKY